MTAPNTPKYALTAAVVGLALAFGAAAQTTPGTAPAAGAKTSSAAAAPNKADRDFVEKAAMGGLSEVALGNLAQEKATNPEVKQFGSKMVNDHGKANDELKQLAASKNIQMPTSLDRKHQADVDKFSKLSGAQFDKAYMSHMVDDHRKDVAEFRKASTSAKDADVKGFASTTLPTLEEHLKLAQTTNDAVKKSK